MARPTKFIPEITDTILKALQIGATYKDAAEAAGVDYDTYNEWIKAGKAAKSGKFYEFSELVKRTEAQARLNYLSTIAQAAAKGDWKAAEAFLKRRDRANWGDGIDVTSGGKPIGWKEIIDKANAEADTE